MIGHLTRYIVLPIIFIVSVSATSQSIVDDFRSKLAEAENAGDSIQLLYNIYDCTPSAKQGEVLDDLYSVALRSGDNHTVNDVLKLCSNFYSNNDSMQHVLLDRARKLPNSDEKRSTEIFIKVRLASKQALAMPEEQREAKLRDYLARHAKSEELETYDRIEYLFYLCTYLRLSTEGELLTRYFKELQDLIDKMPSRDIVLKSLFYTQAASTYLVNDMFEEAVVANKTLLEIISELEEQYHAKGRVYRNYDRSSYICYRRLLRCHDALTPEEVDDYYNKIVELTKRDLSLANDFEKRQRPTIYYLMAKQRYSEAIPLIRAQLDDPDNTRSEQLYLVEALLKAAESTGDKEDMLIALRKSNDMLRERIDVKANESYNELQLVYEVNDLKQVNDELVMANQQIVLNRHKEQLTYAIVSLVVLVLLLIVVYLFYHRSKRLTANLTKSNAMIIDERDTLKRTQKDLIEARDKAKVANRIKTDFVNNMSHEIRTPLEAIVELRYIRDQYIFNNPKTNQS